MAAEFTVNIYTPAALVVHAQASYVSVQAPDGGFGLMKNHLPCVIALVAGEIVLTVGDRKRRFQCSDGFLEMRNNRAQIFVNTCKEVKG